MSQCDQILGYMKRGRAISPLIALEKFGCFRLAARIHDLRAKGHPIESREVIRGDKHFAEYYMKRGR